MMTDPVADMATRIRNSLHVESTYVDVPFSFLKEAIAKTLQSEGFIWDYEVKRCDSQNSDVLRINFKYGPSGERVLRSIRRVSMPGRRVYCSCDDLPVVVGGMGVVVVSTNRGVISDREARAKRLGGEVLIEVW